MSISAPIIYYCSSISNCKPITSVKRSKCRSHTKDIRFKRICLLDMPCSSGRQAVLEGAGQERGRAGLHGGREGCVTAEEAARELRLGVYQGSQGEPLVVGDHRVSPTLVHSVVPQPCVPVLCGSQTPQPGS